MKRTPILAAAVLAATLFLVSCKNSGTTGLPIPKDAAMVLHVNTSSLTSKLSWEEIKSTDWFREMAKDANDSLAKKMLENPENSGIDTKGNLVFFAKKHGKSGYMVFEGKLKDAAAFESMLKQISAGVEIMTDGDLKSIKTDNKSIVSWNSKQFILMADAPFFNMMPSYDEDGDNKTFGVDSLKKFTKDLLALKSDNSLEDDDRFASLLKDGGDVQFWMNSSEYMASMGNYLSMLKIGALLEGNAVSYSLNFEDGRIAVKSKAFFGKEMTKLMDKYGTKNVGQDLVNRIPSQDVVGAMAMNFDPVIMKEFLVASGVDGMINGFLGEKGLSLDELINASKGEFLIAVSDVTMQKKEKVIPALYEGGEPYTYTTTEPDMNFLFATSVKNKGTFDKLLNIAKEEMKGELEDTSKVNYKSTNDWFVVSNRATVVDQFLAGKTNKISFADKISGHPFGMYIDIQKILKATSSTLSNATDSASYDASMKMWQDVLATGGEYKDGVCTMEFVVSLVDKSKNSLKALNEYSNKMYAAQQLRKKYSYEEDAVATDTAAIVAPVQVP